MQDLTGFQRVLLYVIADLEQPHGLALNDELEDYYQTEIHHGRLYPNLDTLVNKGLVEKGQYDKRTTTKLHSVASVNSKHAVTRKISTGKQVKRQP